MKCQYIIMMLNNEDLRLRLIWIYLLDKSPIPATKRPIPDANNTESKPLSCHSFKKYTIKAKTDTNQSHFKYFITLN